MPWSNLWKSEIQLTLLEKASKILLLIKYELLAFG